MKVTQLSTLAISLALSASMLVACQDKPKEEPASETAKTETTEKASQDADKTSTTKSDDPADHMAQVTLNAPIKIIEVAIGTDLPAEKKECLGKIDMDSQLAVAKEHFVKNFTPEELKDLSEFYAQPEVAEVIDYGTDQVITMMGLPVESSAQLNVEGMKKVTEYASTDIGKKYTEFNMKEGEGTLNTTLIQYLNKEMANCGIDMPS